MKANDIQHGGDHYNKLNIQTWDYIVANDIGFLDGNAIKYLSRWRSKGGVEDIKKALHYVQKLLEVETSKQGAGPVAGVLRRPMTNKKLLDDDGENLALRRLLMAYSCDKLMTVGYMRKQMDGSGYGLDFYPKFIVNAQDSDNLSKAGAQLWIRHLIAMESK